MFLLLHSWFLTAAIFLGLSVEWTFPHTGLGTHSKQLSDRRKEINYCHLESYIHLGVVQWDKLLQKQRTKVLTCMNDLSRRCLRKKWQNRERDTRKICVVVAREWMQSLCMLITCSNGEVWYTKQKSHLILKCMAKTGINHIGTEHLKK